MQLNTASTKECSLCKAKIPCDTRGRRCTKCRATKQKEKDERRKLQGLEEAKRRGEREWRLCSRCNTVKNLSQEFCALPSIPGSEVTYTKLCKTCQREPPQRQLADKVLSIVSPETMRDKADDSSSSTAPVAAKITVRQFLCARSRHKLDRVAGEMKVVSQTTRDDCTEVWAEYLRHYDLDEAADDRYIPRIATFHPSLVGSATTSLCGDYEITQLEDVGGCKVLYASTDELQRVLKLGVLPDVSFILVPGGEPNDCQLQTDALLKYIGYTYPDHNMEYQAYQRADGDSATNMMPVSRFLEIMEAMKVSPEISRPYSNAEPPFNFLNISGARTTRSSTPSIVHLMGLTLLNHLIDAAGLGSIGKQAVQPSLLRDAEDCGNFHLWAQPGTIHPWHLDVLGMTWLQVLCGDKAWGIYDGPDDECVWDEFSKEGRHWKPPIGTLKTIPLSQGDVLIMMPGKFTAHMPISCGDSFTHMKGGQVWPQDPHYLESLLNGLRYTIVHNPVVTNEHIPRQLPDLLLQLKKEIAHAVNGQGRLTSHQPRYEQRHYEAVENFITNMKKHLSCNCIGGKCAAKDGQSLITKTCPCHDSRSDLVAHTGGCTAFCHGGRFITAKTRDCLPRRRK